MDRKKILNILKTPLKLTITGALLYFVFQKIDLAEVREVYLQSNPIYFLLATLIFFGSQVVSSSRLLVFLQARGIRLGFGYNLRLYLLGMFYNLFLPGGIGGDGYKVYLLRSRFGHPAKKLIGTLLLDRLSGLWAMGFIAAFLLLFIPEIELPLLWVAGAFVLASALYLFVSVRFFGLPLAAVATGHALALLVQCLQVLAVWMLLLSLQIPSGWVPYLFTFLASSLVAIFPLTIGGLGAREYVFVLAAEVLPMNEHVAVFVSLMVYLISALVALAGMYFVFGSGEFAPMPNKRKAEEQTEEELANAPQHR